jgi:coenzyme PQQ precursor peptide PqqA
MTTIPAGDFRLARKLPLLKAQEILSPGFSPEVSAMKWDTPSYNDIRFGFEVTMYINNK